MKRNKILCLDEDVVEFLKGQNASKLVNDLLLEAMQKARYEGMNREQLLAERAVIALEKETKKKIAEMRKNVQS